MKALRNSLLASLAAAFLCVPSSATATGFLTGAVSGYPANWSVSSGTMSDFVTLSSSDQNVYTNLAFDLEEKQSLSYTPAVASDAGGTADVVISNAVFTTAYELPGVDEVGGIDSQAAICVYTNTSTGGALQYYGWAGDYTVVNDETNLTWFALSGANPVAGEAVTVTMSFDYTTSPATVTFKIGNTTLTPSAVELVNNTRTQVSAVSFSGQGSIGELAGETLPAAPSEFLVSFFDEGAATATWTTSVVANAAPAYDGPALSKQSTAQYDYEFAGWTNAASAGATIDLSQETIVSVTNYYAKYTATLRSYTITFENEDGTELQSGDIAYGTAPAYAGSTPTKAATAQYTYTHSGWTDGETTYGLADALPGVTGAKTYTATFSSTVNEYAITWTQDDDTVIDTTTVAYGTVPTHADPTKAATDEYTYAFSSWTPQPVAVTGVATYKASYTATKKKYTVKFLDEDGTELSSAEVEYGTVPTAPADPTKAGDAQYTWTFDGWDSEVVAVTGAKTYTATYTSTVNTYTVVWKNEDGTVLETDQNVAYGTMPSYDGATPAKAATTEKEFTFNAWAPVVSSVTGDAEYTATYTEAPRTYTITWSIDGATTTEELAYGATPSHADPTKAADAQYTYSFTGWDPAITSVTGDQTYTAQFSSTVNSYTISWDTDGDGTVDDTTMVAYGTVPTHADGSKAADAQYTYTFDAWSPSLVAVVGDALYTATFTATEIVVPTLALAKPTLGSTVLASGTAGATVAAAVTPAATVTGASSTAGVSVEMSGATAAFTGLPWNEAVDWTLQSENAEDLPGRFYAKGETSWFNVETNDFDDINDLADGMKGVEADAPSAAGQMVRIQTCLEISEGAMEELPTGEDVGAARTGFAVAQIAENGDTAPAFYAFNGTGWDKLSGATPTIGTNDLLIVLDVEASTARYYVDGIALYKDNAGTRTYAIPMKTSETAVINGIGFANPDGVKSPVVAEYDVPFEAAVGDTPYAAAADGLAAADKTGVETLYLLTNDVAGTISLAVGDILKVDTEKGSFAEAAPVVTSAAGHEVVSSVSGDVTTYTVDPIVYAISYELDGGSWPTGYTATNTYTIASPAITLASPAKADYDFLGWVGTGLTGTNETVTIASGSTGDRAYTSIWQRASVQIRFLNYDGSVLQSSLVEIGETPAYSGETPTKTATAQYTYAWTGWDPAIVAATVAADYTATFSETLRSYDVTFSWHGDSNTTSYEFGQTPTAPTVPASYVENGVIYTFQGWNATIVPVEGIATYTAVYDEGVTAKATVFTVADNGAMTNTVGTYATLAQAVAAAVDGATVLLLDDVTLTERVEPNAGANTAITIDLGGYTIARTGTSGNGSAFDVKSGDVTITNGVIVCTQDDTAIAKDGVYAITSRSGSTVTLADLTVTVDSECGACVYPFAGSTMTIESGTYANTTTTPYRYNTAITGMAVNQPNNATQNLIIKGGSFSQYDPQLGDDSGAMTDFTDDGFVAIDDGNGHWVVQPGYNVTFDANGGTPAPEAQRVAAGALVMAPATNPAKAGDDTVVYVFNAWQLNDADFDFAVAPTADITLVADYTATSLANAIWIGGASGDWDDAANWDIGYVPTKATVVTFTNDCSVGIYRDTDHCKTLVVNAAVTLVRADQGEGYTGSVRLNFWGDNIDSWTKIGTAVSGTGTLGVTSVDLCNATSSTKLTIDADLSLAGDITFTRDQSGDTSIAFTVNGATTFADGTRISAVAAGRNSAGANTTFKGAITIPASGNVTFYSDNWGQFTVSSKITLVHPESAGDAPTTLVLWQAESGFLYMDGSVATDDTDNFYVSETSANGKRTFQVLPKPTVIWVVEGQTPVTNKVDYGTATASIQPADPASYVANGTIYTFTGWSPAVAETVTADATYTAQFSSVAAKATVFTVADNGATTNVVGTYASLAEAVGAAPAGAVVQVLADVALASTVVVDKDLTIDLNGNDIAATDARALWIKSGDVTLDGTGTVSANGEGLAETSSVIRVGDSAANAAAAKLTIGKGVTVSSAKSYGVTVFGKNSDGDASTTDIALDVYGTVAVTSTGEADAAISGNGSSGLSAVDVTIRDGAVVSATNQTGIYFPGAGTLSIEGGSITAPTAVYAKAGTVAVSGGTLTATGAKTDYQYYGNGPKATGDALVLDNCGYPNGTTFAASITGGTFVSQNAQSVASYAYGADATTQEAREPLADFIPATVDGQPNPARFSDADADGVPAGYALVLVEGSDPEMYAVSAQAPIQWYNTWAVPNVFYFDDEDPIPSRATQGTIPTIKREGETSYHAVEDWVQISWTVTSSSATDASTPDDSIATVDGDGLVTFSQPGTVKVWLTMTDPSGATKSSSKTVKYDLAPAYVVSADGSTRTAYGSLSGAFNAAQDGETVVLGKDATVTNLGRMTLNADKAITLDLNGHTATLSQNYREGAFGALFTVNKGSLTVVDTAETKGGIAVSGTNCRAFSMDGTANQSAADAVLTIGEGVNVSSASDCCVTVFGKATLNTAGNLSSPNDFAIAGNGSAGNEGTVINVTGGTVSGDEVAIYQPQDGELNISGGTITGNTAVYVKSGDVSVTGGTLHGTGTAADYSFNGSGANATGDALVIESCGYPGGAPTASITGGTFLSDNAQSVASYAKDENYTAPDNFIPGTSTAKFSDADADGVAEGYTLTPVEGTSNPVLYEVVPAFTILWVAEGVTLQTDVVATNTTPVYTNGVPTKAGHEFLAWSPVPAPAVSNTTYTATWTVNQYDVIWVASGSQFESNRVDYGTAMPVPGTDPTKDGGDDALYTFVGWTPAPDATVTSNATYTAEFKTWTKVAVPTAAEIVYTGSEQTGVSAAANGEYTISGNTGTAAGDYTATVTLADTANTVWATDTAAPTANAAKTIPWSIAKAPLSNLAVTLAGWTEGDTAGTPSVSGNAGNGTETISYWSEDGQTALGGQPTAAGTYMVKVDVAETANYQAGSATALFTIDERGVYTIIWLADDGTTEYDRTQVTDGDMPQHDEPTKTDPTGKYGYRFEGWDPEVVVATAATSYQATFSTFVKTKLALPLADPAVDATVNGASATVALAPVGTIDGVTYAASPAAGTWTAEAGTLAFSGLAWNQGVTWSVTAEQGEDDLAETAYNEGAFYAKASVELFTAAPGDFEKFNDMGVAGVGYSNEVASAAGETVRVHTTIDVPDGGLESPPDVGEAKAGFAVLQLAGDADPAFYAYDGESWTKLSGVDPVAGEADYLAVYDFAAATPAVRYYIDGAPLYAEGDAGAKVYAIPLPAGMDSLSTVAFGSAEMVKDDVVAVQDVSYVAAVGDTPYTNVVDALAAIASADKAEANNVTIALLQADLDPGAATVALAVGEAVTVDTANGSFAGDAPFVAAAAPTYKVVSAAGAAANTTVYTVELNEATVIWLAENGTQLYETNLVIGTVPVYVGAAQTKAATDAALFTFAGWTDAAGVLYADALPAVAVGGTNYTATFKTWTKVARPVAASGLVYSGGQQTGVTVAEGSSATGTTAATNAGDYTATVTLSAEDSVWADATDPADAAARESVAVEWSIAPAAVTVAADDKSKVAGNADPELTVTVSGVVDGDEFTPAYTIERETGETAGTYAIAVSGTAAQGNYLVSFVNGTFTIAGAEAMVISVADAETGATTTNYVAKLADAFGGDNGAKDGETVELLGDVTVDARIVVANSVTIDLGGHTITRTAAPAGDNGSVFRVDGDYDVTIRNGAIDCSGVDDSSVASDGVYAIDAKNGADLTLADLSITVDSECGACVYPWANSTVTIESGTYANVTMTPYRYKTDWTGMAVNQANVADTLITITGGTFSQVNPMLGDDSAAEGAMNFVDADYFAVSEGGAFTVVPRIDIALATITVADNLVYNGAAQAGVASVDYGTTNLVADTDFTVVYADNVDAGEDTAVATLTGVGLWKGTATANFSIAKMALTVTAASDTKVYDGTALTKDDYTATALATGDAFASVTVSGTITDVGAVSNEVTAVSITNALGTVVTANYAITTVDGELKVTPAAMAITIAGVDSTSVYTGAEQTTNVAWTATSETVGFVATKVSYTGDVSVAGTDVADYAYNLDATKFVYADDNFTATFTVDPDGKFAITPAKIAVPTAVAGLVYDGTEKTGVEPGTGYTLEGNTATAAGGYTATATLAANYAWEDETLSGPQTVAWSIGKATVAVTAENKTQVYGEAAEALTYTTAPATLVEGNSFSGALAREEGDGVGTYAIGIGTLSAGDNYEIDFTGATYTITAAPMTITVAGYNGVYDGAAHEASATTVPDGATVTWSTDGGETWSDTVPSVTGVANVAIVAKATLDNYADATATTSLVVTARAVALTAASDTKVYDGTALVKDAFTATNLVSGHTATATVTGSQTAVGASSNVVSAAVIKDAGDNDVTANYNVAYVDGELKVTAATVQIPAAPGNKEYNGAAQTSGATATDTYSVVDAGGVNAGDYTVTYELADKDNYTWSDGSTTNQVFGWKITPAAATVKADNGSKKHGEADPAEFTATVSGLKGSDTEAVLTYTVARAEGEAVGTYTITPAGEAAQGNYTVTYETGTFTIEQNQITIIWVVEGNETTNKVEWGDMPAFAGSTEKASDAKYAYSFTGWTPAVTNATVQAIYTAGYAKTIDTPLALAVADEKLDSTAVSAAAKTATVAADLIGAVEGVAVAEASGATVTIDGATATASFSDLEWNQGVEWTMTAAQTAEDDAQTAESASVPGKFYVKPETAWFTASAEDLSDLSDASDAAVGYTADNASNEGEMVRVHTTVEVPAGGLPQAPETGTAKVGFAVLQLEGDSAPAFYAYGNGTWTKLAGVEPKEGEHDYYAVYDLAAETPTARYYIDGVALYAPVDGGADVYALPLAAGTTSLKSISFASKEMVKSDVVAEQDVSYVAAVETTPYTDIGDALTAAGTAGEKTLALLKTGVALDPAVTLGSGEKLVVDYAKGTFTNETPVVSGVPGYGVKVAETETVKTYELDAIVYPIEYVLDGGENAAANTNEYTVETLPVALADASRIGYTFGGWTNNVAAGVQTSIPVGTTGAVTNVATWSINKYLLTINYLYTNGTEAATAFTSNMVYGTDYSVDSPAIAGYTADKTVVSGNMGAEPVTVDVTYTVNRYSVTFVDEDGSTVLKAATEYDYGTPVADIATPETPAKAATAEKVYTFAGWTPAIETVTSNAVYKASYSEADTKAAVITVAQDGTTNTIYVATIADAIATAGDGDTIQLIGDVEGDATIEHDVTIDLNGNTWTGDVSVSGDVTIVDESDDADGKLDGAVAVVQGGSVEVAGGTVDDGISGAGDVVVSGGTVNGGIDGTGDVAVSGGTVNGGIVTGGDLEITGGTVVAGLDEPAIVAGGTAAISGGTVTGDVEARNGGDVTISGDAAVSGNVTASGTGGENEPSSVAVTGGSVTGSVVAEDGATATVSGGAVTGSLVATGDDSLVSVTDDGSVGSVSATNGGSAVITGGTVANGITASGDDAVTVTGGTVNGTITGEDGSVVITGGHFEKDPSDYVADGYAAVEGDPDGYDVIRRIPLEGAVITVAGGPYTGTGYTVSSVDFGTTNLLLGTDYTVVYTNATGNVEDNVNAGTITATVTGIGKWIGTITQDFAITPVEVTVTATDKSVRRGTDPEELEFAVTYSGFVNNETKDVLTTEATADDAANASDETYSAESRTGATFPIVASGAAAANYTFTYVDGTLTVVAGAIAAVEGTEYDAIADAVAAAGRTESGKVVTMLDDADAAVVLAPGDMLKVALEGFDLTVKVSDENAARYRVVASDPAEGVTTYTVEEVKANGLMITEFDFEGAYLVYDTGKAADLAWDSDKAYCTVVTATDLKAERWDAMSGTSVLHSALGENAEVTVENLDTTSDVRFFRIAVTPFELTAGDSVEFAAPAGEERP